MKKSFLSYFCTMKDHRINRKKRHPLINIVALTIAAAIGGAETWEDVAFLGDLRKKFFSQFLDLVVSEMLVVKYFNHLLFALRCSSLTYNVSAYCRSCCIPTLYQHEQWQRKYTKSVNAR